MLTTKSSVTSVASRWTRRGASRPTPSRADIQMTQAIIDVATPLGIAVHDHIIVGKNGQDTLFDFGPNA